MGKIVEGIDAVLSDETLWLGGRKVLQKVKEQIEQLQAELERAKILNEKLAVENAKLNLILFHRENGLAHPDLNVEIDKSKFAEVEAENKRLKKAIEDYGNNPAGFDWAVLEEIEQLKEALEWIRDASERPKCLCLCGRPTGTGAIKKHAEQALKDKED